MKKLVALLLVSTLISPANAMRFGRGVAGPQSETFQEVGGQGFEYPQWPINMGTLEDGAASNQFALNSTTTWYAVSGRYYNAELSCQNHTATKNIQNIGFLVGGKTGSWTAQISLQGTNTAAGPPSQPDGTIKGGGNAFVSAASTSIAASAFFMSSNLGATATVHCGDQLTILIKLTTWSSGALNPAGPFGTDPTPFGPSISTSSDGGTTWTPGAAAAGGTAIPDIMFKNDDLTYGGFEGIIPLDFTNALTSFNSGSTPREYGLEFSLPMDTKEEGFCYAISQNSGGNATFELTDEASTPNVLETMNVLASQNRVYGSSQGKNCYPHPVRASLTRNTNYVIGMLPTTTNNISTPILNLPVGAINLLFGCGSRCSLVSRTGGGAWGNATQLQIPFWDVQIGAYSGNSGP